MSGEGDLTRLLAGLRPQLDGAEYVFCCLPLAAQEMLPALSPRATFVEDEGLTVVLTRVAAEAAGLAFDGVFRRIELRVHSSLAAVGLTAAVAARLTAHGISANVLAAYYHDHVFVPAARADAAMAALQALWQEHAVKQQ